MGSNFGSDNHLEYSVIGRDVNIVSRLQAASESEKLLI